MGNNGSTPLHDSLTRQAVSVNASFRQLGLPVEKAARPYVQSKLCGQCVRRRAGLIGRHLLYLRLALN